MRWRLQRLLPVPANLAPSERQLVLKTNVRTSAGGEDRSSRSVRGRGDSIKKLLRYFLLFCVVPSAQIHVLIIFLVKKINYELIYYDCRTLKRRSRFDETPKSFLASCAAKASELSPFFLFRTAAAAAAECTVSGVATADVPICCWLAAAEFLGSSCVAGAKGADWFPAAECTVICCWLAAAELPGSSCVECWIAAAD